MEFSVVEKPTIRVLCAQTKTGFLRVDCSNAMSLLKTWLVKWPEHLLFR